MTGRPSVCSESTTVSVYWSISPETYAWLQCTAGMHERVQTTQCHLGPSIQNRTHIVTTENFHTNITTHSQSPSMPLKISSSSFPSKEKFFKNTTVWISSIRPSMWRVSSSRVGLVVGKQSNTWSTHPVADLTLNFLTQCWQQDYSSLYLPSITTLYNFMHFKIHYHYLYLLWSSRCRDWCRGDVSGLTVYYEATFKLLSLLMADGTTQLL